MTRHLGLTIATFALLVAFIAAQEPAPGKGDKEPAKKQPADQPPAKEVKDDAKDAKAPDQPAAPAEKAESPDKIIERLFKEYDDAGDGLEKPDTGDKTRDVQKKIIDDLDKLIKQENDKNSNCNCNNSSSSSSSNSQSKSNNPSSSQSKSDSPSSGKGSSGQADNQPNPSKGQGDKGEKKEDKGGLAKKNDPTAGKKPEEKQAGGGDKGKEKKDQSAKQDGDKDKDKGGKSKGGKDGGSMVNKEPDAKKNPIADENKAGNWGQLPPHLRKQMDVFAGDQIMSRYEELLRQYFKAAAEQGRKKEGE
jgi:hypothetical protein